jgi:pectin methylesterase-like acyl-CoA thioesterase
MLRNTWIVIGAVLLISVAHFTTFPAEVAQSALGEGESVQGSVETSTWTVCSDGCDFTSIQAAVDAAGDGDTLELGAETFYESVYVHRNVRIRGQGPQFTAILNDLDLCSPGLALQCTTV